MKKNVSILLTGILLSTALCTNAQTWSLTGNAGTDPATNYIGTSDSKPLKIKTNNQVRLYIKSTGDIGVGTQTPTSKLHVNGVITATGGTSTDWNAAYSWGNHALAGYLTSESDPQVGANTINYVPSWNGSALATSNIYSSGSFAGINTATSIGASQFVVNSTSSGYGGMYVNTTGSTGVPFYGYANNNVSSCWTYLDQATSTWGVYNNGSRLLVENDGDVRIGTATATSSKLDITATSTSISPVVSVLGTFAGNTDVRGISSTSIAAPGYGFGLHGTGGYMGVYGLADATTYSSFAYGVYGNATGSTGTRIGVYGSASGGTENWGGYFGAKVYTPELRIGSTTGATGYLLSVNGKIMCTELRVQSFATWPDYVFADDYKLASLYDLEQQIKTNKHLPGVPSAEEVCNDGIAVGEMQKVMMEKIEELTLYIIQLKKDNDKLNERIQSLEIK